MCISLRDCHTAPVSNSTWNRASPVQACAGMAPRDTARKLAIDQPALYQPAFLRRCIAFVLLGSDLKRRAASTTSATRHRLFALWACEQDSNSGTFSA